MKKLVSDFLDNRSVHILLFIPLKVLKDLKGT